MLWQWCSFEETESSTIGCIQHTFKGTARIKHDIREIMTRMAQEVMLIMIMMMVMIVRTRLVCDEVFRCRIRDLTYLSKQARW